MQTGASIVFCQSRVLEVGSWDACGSIRNLFEKCEYIGIDIADGPGVDLLSRGEDLSLDSGSFDLVISCECFEHNKYWPNTLANMIRLLKPRGLCIISCAWLGRTEHGTPRSSPGSSLTALTELDSYYMNLRAIDLINTCLLRPFSDFRFAVNLYSRDLYFVGIKSGPFESVSPSRLDAIINKASRVGVSVQLSRSRKLLECSISVLLATAALLLGEKLFHSIRFYAHSLGIKTNRKSLIHGAG